MLVERAFERVLLERSSGASRENKIRGNCKQERSEIRKSNILLARVGIRDRG
jgi:hypothetical protein